jgi:hypothetical protein
MEPYFLLMYACIIIFFYLIFTGTIEIRYKGHLLNGTEIEEVVH